MDCLNTPPPNRTQLLKERQAILDKRDTDCFSLFLPLTDVMASSSFISWAKGYTWSQLWLVYLRTETLRTTPKELPKLHLFQGNSKSSPAQHRLPTSETETEKVSAPLSQLKKFKNQEFSLSSAGILPLLPSPPISETTVGAAYITLGINA